MVEGEEEISEYSPKSEFSKARVVEESVKKCIVNRGVELKEGYYNYRYDNQGNVIKTWIPDSRKVFISSVVALRYLLNPEVNNQTGYKDKIIKIKNKERVIFEKYYYSEYNQSVDKDNRLIWKPTNKKIIPEIDALVVIKETRENIGKEVVGGWNNKVRNYWNEMVVLHEELFGILNDLINKLNYFKRKSRY